jgi:peptidoglycan/LPS O-acetylase OafA/YrhL
LPARPGHLPHLDALRGLAIIGVLLNHMVPVPGAALFGWMGVALFFVLSGFLITRILLADRDEAETAGTTWPALASFYLRRALRIFPVYYLCVFGLVLLGAWGIVPNLRWLLTYTYNFRFAAHPEGPWIIAHFWSLCVEEQFYLVWPFVLLFLPRRYLLPAMVAVVLLAPACRLWFALRHADRLWLYAFPLCSLDCLGLGGLLALVERQVGTEGLARSSFVRWCGWATAVAALAFLFLAAAPTPFVVPDWFGQLDIIWVVGNSCLALMFTYGVAASCCPGEGDWARLLEMRWLRYTGQISYGLYIYHMLVIGLLEPYSRTALSFLSPWVFWFCLPTTFLVATASWYCFEKPLLGLKGLFSLERVSGWFGRPAPTEGFVSERRAA